MCNCKKTKVEAPPSIPVEELKFPDTPDGLLAKELNGSYCHTFNPTEPGDCLSNLMVDIRVDDDPVEKRQRARDALGRHDLGGLGEELRVRAPDRRVLERPHAGRAGRQRYALDPRSLRAENHARRRF